MINEKSSCGIGIVANLDGKKSHNVITDGIKIMERLQHRAGHLEDGTSDGAGIMTEIPFEYFKDKIDLPNNYAVMMVFFSDAKKLQDIFTDEIRKHINIFKIREVPIDKTLLSDYASKSLPSIKQLFIQKLSDKELFEKRLLIEQNIYKNHSNDEFYITSMSNYTIVYKGLLKSDKFLNFYLDLNDQSFKSSFSIVHQRFSTNTLPAWYLAQPFRVLAHNGEINTIKGNLNWMEARLKGIDKDSFLDRSFSDTANLDMVIEYLINTGYSLTEALTYLIPTAWEKDKLLDDEFKDYYKYNSYLMEPWDGPAAFLMSDGKEIIATLDRNGLRPCRYIITKDNRFILSSEIGVLDTLFDNIKDTNRLEASKLICLNLDSQKVLFDREIKEKLSKETNYSRLVKDVSIQLPNILIEDINDTSLKKQYGYTDEVIKKILEPMILNEKEAIGSLSYDIKLPFMNDESILFFDYFKQRFAEVTNPPLDSIREKIVFSSKSILRTNANIVSDISNLKVIEFDSPVIDGYTYKKIKNLNNEFKAKVIYGYFSESLEKGLDKLVKNVDEAIKECNILILSDELKKGYPIPSLLLVSTVHHHLIDIGKRLDVSIVIKSQEVKETNHFTMMLAYGADLIYPSMALEVANEIDKINGKKNYIKAVNTGILKIMSKMGISSVMSYKGAKTYDALGISSDVINKYLKDTYSPIGGMTLKDIEIEVRKRFSEVPLELGEYSYKKNGYIHAYNALDFKRLQDILISKDYTRFKDWSLNEVNKEINIRDLFSLRNCQIDIDEVESESDILKRFVAGAMSFGALSQNAHEDIARVFNDLNAMSNSGEGGERKERFSDNRNSKVKQVASGRFGVNAKYLLSADEIQIKMAQGAKPGEGGHLPGHKVSSVIAKTRFTKKGTNLISPPPHHDIYSIEDLAQLIYDMKSVNDQASVSVKLASTSGIGVIASGVVKTGADKIVISGFNGSTGASPMSSLKYTGMPLEIGLKEVHDKLIDMNLRQHVKLQADSQIRTAYDIIKSFIFGADEVAFGMILLGALECIACRRCHTNKCPKGLTTQDELYKKLYTGKYDNLKTYLKFLARHTRELLAFMGYQSLDDLIGQTDVLVYNNKSYKASKLDFSNLLVRKGNNKLYKQRPFRNECNEMLKDKLKNVDDITIDIKNTDRAFGLNLAYYHQENKIVRTNGYAGQSFCAYIEKNIKVIHTGFVNDSFAKGLCGGTIILKKPVELDQLKEHLLVGNVALYGATSGEVYINGKAGERFAIRNSGVNTVVEGIGKHGLEYMTGGVVTILGDIDYNFGAGMSGGVAYLYNTNNLEKKINTDSVKIIGLNDEDKKIFTDFVLKHYRFTSSLIAKKILNNIDKDVSKVKKVIKK